MEWWSSEIWYRSSVQIQIKGSLSINGTLETNNVWFVDGLKYTLLSVTQMCDNGYCVVFNAQGCEIRKSKSGQVVVEGKRTESNVYDLREVEGKKCLLGQFDESWLWE